ncbi:hypothetical protein [Kurthia massiliensis]|uniref:hypothetical protein n=1 Tax=Kurthia massiliensis TaxID=1033739 RepID=UPI000288693B|nr:hypothetical protein [Kurthia massiliensis]
MDLKKLSFPRKLMLGASAVAIISLFLPWVDLGIVSASGFQQQGYLFLIAFIYPVYAIFKNKPIHKIGGLACGIIAIVASFIFMNSKSGDLFGATINATGSGLYVFLIASIVLTIGVWMDTKKA